MTRPSHTQRVRPLARLVRRIAVAAVLATACGTVVSIPASAHPLGNFTINLYDGLTISREAVLVDHVLDLAEIPALQERQRMDVDRDGAVSDAEGAAWAEESCRAGSANALFTLDGSRIPLKPTAVGLTFPSGEAGLVTLRLVCTYTGRYEPLTGLAQALFSNDSFSGRIGWREIVIRGDGVTLSGADAFATGSSGRLTSYPPAQLEAPRNQSAASFAVTPGGQPAPAWAVTDAVPLGSEPELIMSRHVAASSIPAGAELPPELGAVLHTQDLTPAAIVLSLAVAVLVGAVHAASPGHGKTLMAAYLVGTRGTIRHALGLGLTVTVSHTLGVLALGAIITFAGGLLPAEQLFPILGLASGLIVTVLGAVLLAQRLSESRRLSAEHEYAHAHSQPHEHGDSHEHGFGRHSHLPPAGNPLHWRNLIALGLVGGLVPSASAILILVGSIAAGRPAYGMVLTLAFGLGMAVVLVAVGVLVVRARALVERLPSGRRLAPVFSRLPLLTPVVFLVVGGTISIQAVLQLV